MHYSWFKETDNASRVSQKRVFKTTDIVKRAGVLPPHRFHVRNYPIDNPVALFNPAIEFAPGGSEYIAVYARLVLGYYMYVSALARIDMTLSDIYEGNVSLSHYSGELIVLPSTRYDIWGVEDPRVTIIEGRYYLTYVGRTVNYFNPAIRQERTVPVVAVGNGINEWEKKYVFLLPGEHRRNTVSNKDAFIVKTREGHILLFHRPHMRDEKFYMVVSRVNEHLPEIKGEGPVEIIVEDAWVTMFEAEFEKKIGWSTPPIEIKPNLYLMIVHGIDKYIEGYRAFAVLLEYHKDTGPRIVAVTREYIMEPRTSYEVYGDRPYVVFPCGLVRISKSEAIISYGAADYVMGFGIIDLDMLLSMLDDNMIE